MNHGNQPEQHEMVVTQTFSSGAQEFFCPVCGRRFIIEWPPNYRRIILEPGNEQVIHSGGTGGLVMGPTSMEAREEVQDSANLGAGGMDDPYLAPWLNWLEENNY